MVNIKRIITILKIIQEVLDWLTTILDPKWWRKRKKRWR